MKKIIAVLLSLVMALPLAACTGAGVSETTTAEEQKPLRLDALTVNGVNISEFKIVYAKSPLASVKIKATLGTEYDFDKQSAEKLRDNIKAVTGITLECVEDSQDESANEILVGKTNRAATDTLGLNSLKIDEYKIAENGSKLAVCGGSYANTWYAADAFVEYLASIASKGKADITANTEIKQTHDVTVIGCIGDSITYGAGSSDVKVNSYPAVLGRMLWKEAVVYNYGHGGTSLRQGTRRSDGLNQPYDKEPEYQQMMEEAPNIDIMLIMLGTNDTFFFPKWTDEDSAIYKTEYKALVDKIIANNSEMTVVIMNCPFYSGPERDRIKGIPMVITAQAELYEELSEQQYKVKHFDMYTFCKIYLKKNMPDGLHPDGTGYIKMADGICDYLKNKTDLLK